MVESNAQPEQDLDTDAEVHESAVPGERQTAGLHARPGDTPAKKAKVAAQDNRGLLRRLLDFLRSLLGLGRPKQPGQEGKSDPLQVQEEQGIEGVADIDPNDDSNNDPSNSLTRGGPGASVGTSLAAQTADSVNQ